MKKAIALISVVICSIAAQSANAAIVSFRFSASFFAANEQFDAPGSFVDQSKAFPVISGIINYDTVGTVRSARTNSTFYNGFSEILLDQFSTASPDRASNTLSVSNFPPTLGTMRHEFSSLTTLSISDAPGIYNGIIFSFRDDTGTAFSNTNIPSSLNLSDFTSAFIVIVTDQIIENSNVLPAFGSNRTYKITQLEQITEIPAPGAAFIILAGLGVLRLSGGFRKKA